jgi:hypothetical protein
MVLVSIAMHFNQSTNNKVGHFLQRDIHYCYTGTRTLVPEANVSQHTVARRTGRFNQSRDMRIHGSHSMMPVCLAQPYYNACSSKLHKVTEWLGLDKVQFVLRACTVYKKRSRCVLQTMQQGIYEKMV